MTEVGQGRLWLGRRVLSARLVKFAMVGGSCALVQLSILHGLVSAGGETGEHLRALAGHYDGEGKLTRHVADCSMPLDGSGARFGVIGLIW